MIGAFVLAVMLTTLAGVLGSERSCRVAAGLRDVVMKVLPERLTVRAATRHHRVHPIAVSTRVWDTFHSLSPPCE